MSPDVVRDMSEASHTPRTHWRALLTAVVRESRAARGRLVFFTLCLAIGVAAVVGVAALVAAVRAGISAESRDLLAADLRVSARQPLPDTVAAFFEDMPHRRADVIEMGAMLSLPPKNDAGEAPPSRLVELKVTDGTYPLYGTLELDPPELDATALGDDAVFVGPEIAAELGVAVGDEVRLGGASFRVAAVVVDEPDRLDFAMTLGPRVFVGTDGLARTDLFGEKSRVKYVSLWAVEGAEDPQRLEELDDALEAALEDTPFVDVQTHARGTPRLDRSLRRVEEYLGLVALLSLLLGGIGVSQIVRAWLAGRTQGVAVLRCLGFRAREIAAMYLGHVALLAVAGCLVGGLAGVGLPWLVRAWAPELFQGAEPALFQPWAFVRGVALGLFVATLFSVPPMTAVWRVPPAAVLRAEAVPLPVPRTVRYGAPLLLALGVFVSAWIQGGDPEPAAWFSAGLLVLAALLYGGARLAAALSARLPRGRFGPYLEHGLAALSRPGSGSSGAIVALGLGVMVVLAMWLIEDRLDDALRTALPEDAPSVFLLDVQPDQWDGVHTALVDGGASSIDAVPVVMARIRAIDGVPVAELSGRRGEDGRRRSSWAYTREQRLTWMDELPEDNVVVDGALWSDPERAEVSLEADFADDLDVGVGSTLSMDVHGVPLELAVTSVRTVDWQSFGINFFFVVEPGVLEGAPHFRLAAARLEPPAKEIALQNELAAAFPNVTLLRVRPILDKLAGVLERLAFGIRALGSFTIVTGLVILAGAVGTTALRRAREAALLKTLGVTRGGVTRLFALEYALSGLVAGLLGAAGAFVLAWAFLEHLAELDARLPYVALPIAALASALLAMLSGLSASLRALAARPLDTLRG